MKIGQLFPNGAEPSKPLTAVLRFGFDQGDGMTFGPLGQEASSPSINANEGEEASSPSSSMRVVSLFAGIGGFDYAFELTKAKVVFQCEYDRYCRSVLRRHWPNVPVSHDIRTLTAAEIPDADIWTAGFPCQDVSLARGNHGRSGFKGNHTSLFFKLVELMKIKKPRVVVLENVTGLLNSHKGCDFALVLHELTTAGYAVSWRVLNARYFGAPQSRSRVFLVAWQSDYRRALTALFEPFASMKGTSERSGFMTETFHPSGAIVPQIAYCVSATSGRHTGNDWSRSYISYKDRVRRPTPTESERLQGYPAGWSMPEDSYALPARGHDGERYKAVGNAVCVPVVRWIAGRVVDLHGKLAPVRPDDSFRSEVTRLAPELRVGTLSTSLSAIMSSVVTGAFSRRWKTGGCAMGDTIVEATASSASAKAVLSLFKDILDRDVPADPYFLTPNAAAGILRRADSVGRTLFGPMGEALAKLVAKTASGGEGEKVATSVRPARVVKRGLVAGDVAERPRAY